MTEISSPKPSSGALGVSRRTLMRSAGAVGAVTLGAAATRLFTSSSIAAPIMSPADLSALRNPPICHVAGTSDVGPVGPARKLKLTWNANAICTVGVPVAAQRGIFARHGLDVELINFGGSTDQLLEAISTGKADAGVGMALRWLKPLEQGFDVRITTAVHGGCMRLFTTPSSGIASIADLKGKVVGVSDMAAPDKNFFSIVAAKQGIDPNDDIQWRQFPPDLLGVALKKGEIQAFSLGDPLAWVIRERDGLREIANNLSGEYQHRACCVLGISGTLIRTERPVAAGLTQALLEAQEYVAANPDEAAALFAQYSPTPVAQLAAMLRSHTHDHHPTGAALKEELAAYTEELKLVHVIKPSTNTARFADKVFADVLSV
ncbi:MAG TPA: ABC transporter substrate-binding protein [Stellaceae bacterium]|nr:ABC transporter substrate-binding protein [Stellaceae bacterium]